MDVLPTVDFALLCRCRKELSNQPASAHASRESRDVTLARERRSEREE